MEPLLQTSLPKISLLSAAFLLLALFCLFKLRSRARDKARRRRSIPARLGRAFASLLLFVLALALVVVAGGVYWLGKQLQQFEIVRPTRTTIGLIECLWKDEEAGQSLIQFTPFSRESSAGTQIYRVKGDEVSISGDVLVWDPNLRILGVRDCYQTTRLEGWVRGREGRSSVPDTLYWLGRGLHPLYVLAQQYEDRLPFLRTKQTRRAFLVPDEDTQHSVFISGTSYSAVPMKVRIGARLEGEAADGQ